MRAAAVVVAKVRLLNVGLSGAPTRSLSSGRTVWDTATLRPPRDHEGLLLCLDADPHRRRASSAVVHHHDDRRERVTLDAHADAAGGVPAVCGCPQPVATGREAHAEAAGVGM